MSVMIQKRCKLFLASFLLKITGRQTIIDKVHFISYFESKGSCALGASSEYLIEGGTDIVNGCYERQPQTNKNDFHPASKYPIYRKTSGQLMFLMLENAPRAHWIISNDFEGKDVRLRKM